VLLPAGIGVFYTLLILVSWKWTAQRGVIAPFPPSYAANG